MAHKKNTTNLTELLLQCVTQPDSMLSMLEWLCTHLMVPKVRQGGCIPFFVTERKRSEAMLIQVVQEAFVQGVSTRKMEKLAHSLGIENLSGSQVSAMSKGLNEQVEEFRNRSLAGTAYPVVNAILIVGHSDTEKVYHQHHIPCKIETTLYARRERYGSGDVTLLTNPGSICFR